MPDRDKLTKEIVAHPDDDDLRLAYADALGNDPRAELIRTQIAMAREWRQHGKTPHYYKLFGREQGLLERHGREWGRHLADLAQHWRFRRGFVEQVTMEVGVFLQRANELYAQAPIRHLNLKGAKDVAAALFASPLLSRIRSLGLRDNHLGDGQVAQLANSPHLGELRWLDLSFNEIGMAGLESLAASNHLPRLLYLEFAENRVEDPVPSPGGVDWDGSVQDMNVPPLGLELQKRYGPRPWLRWVFLNTRDTPPSREEISESS
jgi:uncharacterized protein (TIGR02996 family)